MNPTQPGDPNPQLHPKTFDSADTQFFSDSGISPGSEEFKARQEFHRKRREGDNDSKSPPKSELE